MTDAVDEAAAPAGSASAAVPSADARGPAPRWVLPVVAALCVLALAIRALVGGHSGFWRDEALFLFVVDEPSWGAMLDFLRQHESHPPLFYAVMRIWVAIAGPGDAAALVVPVVLGGALVPALYAVGARLLSWRVGLLAAALAALSPILVQYGAMARPYSLLPLLALAATYALVRGIDLGGWRRWAGYAAAMLALVYTHNWGWLVLGAQWVALAVCLWRGVPRPRRVIMREWALAQAAIAVGFLPWLPAFLHQGAHAGHTPFDLWGAVTSPSTAIVVATLVARLLLSGTFLPARASAVVSGAFLWALCVSALAVLIRRPAHPTGPRAHPTRTALIVLVVTPTAAVSAALLLSPRSNLLLPYCIAVVAPSLLLVVAHGLDRLRASGQGRLVVVTAAVLLAAYAALLPPLYQVPRSDARELARAVAAEAAPSDLILVVPWWLASSFNRYYAPATEQIDFPALGRVGVTPFDDSARRIGDPGALAAAEQRIAAGRAGGRRVWLVFDPGATRCASAACGSPHPDPSDVGLLGVTRTLELRAYLGGLYGDPSRCDTTTYASAWDEKLAVCLFTPR